MEEEEPGRLLHTTSNNSISAAALGPSIAVVSPSFNAYSSSDSLAQIAARVVSEFHGDDDDQVWMREINDEYEYDNNIRKQQQEEEQQEPPQNDDVKEEEEEEEEEFEFTFVCSKEAPTSPISAEEVFYNGQIRPSYPVFDQSLLNDEIADVDKTATTSEEEAKPKPRRRPLRMLMIEEERDQAASCSSSEADDLENLPPGTYCVWAPPSKDSGGKGGGGDRSSSAGSSSKRWKFRDFISRSSSDGATKDTFVFFSPATTTKDGDKEEEKTKVVVSGAEDGDKRRSFLPYKKQDLVGFFSNVNGLSRNLHPF